MWFASGRAQAHAVSTTHERAVVYVFIKRAAERPQGCAQAHGAVDKLRDGAVPFLNALAGQQTLHEHEGNACVWLIKSDMPIQCGAKVCGNKSGFSLLDVVTCIQHSIGSLASCV